MERLTKEELLELYEGRINSEAYRHLTEEQKKLAEERGRAFDERRAKRIEELRAEGFDV